MVKYPASSLRQKKLPASGFKLYLSSANGQSILIHNMRPQHQVRIRSNATAPRKAGTRPAPPSPAEVASPNSPRAGQSLQVLLHVALGLYASVLGRIQPTPLHSPSAVGSAGFPPARSRRY